MDLIKQIEKVLLAMPVNNVVVDINYDEQNKIIGYVCSESFKNVPDSESQKMIWDSLKNNFGLDDLINIDIIFHETPRERINRISESKISLKSPNRNNYWLHKAPDNSKYWVFIDVTKFENEYKAVFLIINGADNYQKGFSLIYTPEILKFMGLEESEIDTELFNNIFENAESEVKEELMRKHDLQTKHNLYGRDNIYNYVYQQFQLVPKQFHEIIFNEKEIILMEPLLKQMENHSIKNVLIKKVELSRMLARQKKAITSGEDREGR